MFAILCGIFKPTLVGLEAEPCGKYLVKVTHSVIPARCHSTIGQVYYQISGTHAHDASIQSDFGQGRTDR